MLNVKKFVNGAQSTAAESNRRGGKGALELSASRNGDKFNVTFKDIGTMVESVGVQPSVTSNLLRLMI